MSLRSILSIGIAFLIAASVAAAAADLFAQAQASLSAAGL